MTGRRKAGGGDRFLCYWARLDTRAISKVYYEHLFFGTKGEIVPGCEIRVHKAAAGTRVYDCRHGNCFLSEL